jgi:hypothetical protein
MSVATKKYQRPRLNSPNARRYGKGQAWPDGSSLDQSRLFFIEEEPRSGSGYIPVDGIFSTKRCPVGTNVPISVAGAFVVGVLRQRHSPTSVPTTPVPMFLDSGSSGSSSESPSAEEEVLLAPEADELLPSQYRFRKSWEELRDCRHRLPKSNECLEELLNGVAARIEGFAKMAPGWDGYSAPAPTAKAAANALRFVGVLRTCGFVPARVAPSVVGAIGLSFRANGRKVYFEFYNTGNAMVLYSDGVSNPIVLDVETTETAFLSAVVQAREYLDDTTSGRNVST